MVLCYPCSIFCDTGNQKIHIWSLNMSWPEHMLIVYCGIHSDFSLLLIPFTSKCIHECICTWECMWKKWECYAWSSDLASGLKYQWVFLSAVHYKFNQLSILMYGLTVEKDWKPSFWNKTSASVGCLKAQLTLISAF